MGGSNAEEMRCPFEASIIYCNRDAPFRNTIQILVTFICLFIYEIYWMEGLIRQVKDWVGS